MIIKFLELTLHNFKDIRDLTITEEQFGDVMRLTGANGTSKTSIGEGSIWCFRGRDLLNKQWTSEAYSPRPINYSFDSVSVSLIFSVDGVVIKLMREIDSNGENQYYKNDDSIKAKEFDAYVDSLFNWEEFLSLYNPAFFFTLHWEKQRELIMKYVQKPLNAEVFKAMSAVDGKEPKELNLHAQRLQIELVKKNIDALETNHKKNKTDKEKLYENAKGSVANVKKRIAEYANMTDLNLDELAMEETKLRADIVKLEAEIEKDREANKLVNVAHTAVNQAIEKVTQAKDDYMKVHGEIIEEVCKTCNQPLDEKAVEAVKANKETRKSPLKKAHEEAVAARNLAQAEYAKLEMIDISAKQNEVIRLNSEIAANAENVRKQNDKNKVAAELAEAQKVEAEHLASSKDSIFVLEAIKSFNATEAGLQASKVKGLFTRLNVRLTTMQSNGTEIPAFMIQMDDKDFTALSQGEKISAGLELHEVIHGLNKLVTPCLIDGAGEYTGDIDVYGQAIICTAEKGKPLKINGQEVL